MAKAKAPVPVSFTVDVEVDDVEIDAAIVRVSQHRGKADTIEVECALEPVKAKVGRQFVVGLNSKLERWADGKEHRVTVAIRHDADGELITYWHCEHARPGTFIPCEADADGAVERLTFECATLERPVAE